MNGYSILTAFTGADAAAYAEVAYTALHGKSVRLDLTALRSVFWHLSKAGVLAPNPFENSAERHKSPGRRARFQPPVAEIAAPAPFLSVPMMEAPALEPKSDEASEKTGDRPKSPDAR